MYAIDARFTDTLGNGVGRWRKYYEADELSEVAWWVRHLVPSAQIRVRLLQRKLVVVIPPQRVSEYLEEVKATA